MLSYFGTLKNLDATGIAEQQTARALYGLIAVLWRAHSSSLLCEFRDYTPGHSEGATALRLYGATALRYANSRRHVASVFSQSLNSSYEIVIFEFEVVSVLVTLTNWSQIVCGSPQRSCF